MSRKLCSLFFILICVVCSAQSDSLQLITDETIEDLLEETDDESDNSDLFDLIEYYIIHPVNLNTATAEELSSVPYLDIPVAWLIISHREKYGNFFSVYELYSLPEVQESVIKKILPFVTVNIKTLKNDPDKRQLESFTLNLRSRVLAEVHQRKGYRDGIYFGSSYKFYNRLSFNYSDNIGAGLLTEKDPGEKRYYDFYSGYISISGWHNFESIIVGDYIVEFGQGLALWNQYSASESSNAVRSFNAKSRGIIPYRSVSENRFFRGTAFRYKWEHADISCFLSKNSLDASVDSISGMITSIPVDGFHRTYSEVNKRNKITETSYGATLNYTLNRNGSVGIMHYSSIFNYPLNTSTITKINSSKFNYYSSYINLYVLNYNIFGELSFFGNSSAAIGGVNYSPSPGFSYTFLIRNYPKYYVNLHGYGFGEHGISLKNESGIYNGFRWKTTAGILNMYYDFSRFPYATASTPLPSEGNEIMISFVSKVTRQIETDTRIKIANKEITEPVEERDQIVKRLKKSFRLGFSYTFSDEIRIRTRLEYSSFIIKDIHSFEEGYLLFEDLRIKTLENCMLYFRVIFYKTDSFNSVIYEFENDLPGLFRTTGLYGEGLRLYFLLRYKMTDKINLSAKYSETYKPGEITLGSGYQEIDGNIDNMFGLQLDLNF